MGKELERIKAELAAGGTLIDGKGEQTDHRNRVFKRVFALDASGTMAGQSMLDAQNMLRRRYKEGDGLFIFNEKVHFVDKNKIGQIVASGGTAMFLCIKEILETVRGIQEIILIGDGMPNVTDIDFGSLEEHEKYDFEGEIIDYVTDKANGVKIHTIGIGWDCEQFFLEQISSLTNGDAHHIDNTESLDQTVGLLEYNAVLEM